MFNSIYRFYVRREAVADRTAECVRGEVGGGREPTRNSGQGYRLTRQILEDLHIYKQPDLQPLTRHAMFLRTVTSFASLFPSRSTLVETPKLFPTGPGGAHAQPTAALYGKL